MPGKTLGEKLKSLRTSRGLSLTEVGNAIGISHNFLSEVERGKKVPSNETIRSLARFFEYDEDELFRLLERIPLRSLEYLAEDEYLQDLLSEIQRKYADQPEKIDAIREKVIKLYRDFIDSED